MLKVTFACGIFATWIGFSLNLKEIYFKFAYIQVPICKINIYHTIARVLNNLTWFSILQIFKLILILDFAGPSYASTRR